MVSLFVTNSNSAAKIIKIFQSTILYAEKIFTECIAEGSKARFTATNRIADDGSTFVQ